jgi:hypothetical protein
VSTAAIRTAVEDFVGHARATLSVPGTKAEASLYSEFRTLLDAVLPALRPDKQWSVVEQANAEDLGIPDFRVAQGNELHGWVELKAVMGKNLDNLTAHDKRQFEKFTCGLTNVLYTTGWDWRLYRDGFQVGKPVKIGDESMFDSHTLTWLVADDAIDKLCEVLNQFIDAPMVPYTNPAQAVEALASRARALNIALVDVGEENAGAWLSGLRDDFRALLYKNGQPFTWSRFVDSYVQIAVFGTLLWRLETGKDISLDNVVALDGNLHPLLFQCMDVLWKTDGRPQALVPLLGELCTTVNLIRPAIFMPKSTSSKYVPDPIIDAYEPFFRRYDPATRDTKGVFYTPAQVVEQIVDGVDELLRSALSHPDGVLSSQARFLDPATGTGTFLLGLLNKVAAEAQAKGWAVDQVVREVIEDRCFAFELFPGPYTIAHQRLEAALQVHGAVPNGRLPIFLTDTLSAPDSSTPGGLKLGLAGTAILSERERADEVKTADEILVILGNPPYERVLDAQNARLELFAKQLFEIVKDQTPADARVNLKSIWDLFVAFWVWSLWALQSPTGRQEGGGVPKINPSDCHGITAYISNRTWIVGSSLGGLRKLVRAGAKEIWVLDLGGDLRGAHGAKSFAGGDDNVFPIQVGVAIVWAVFDRNSTTPAKVHYRRLYGKKAAKLAELTSGFDPTQFQQVAGSNADPFVPVQWDNATMADAPTLMSLFADSPVIGIQTARDKKEYSPLGTDSFEVYAENKTAKTKAGRRLGKLALWAELTDNQRFQAWSTAQSKRTGRRVPDPDGLDPTKVRPFTYRPLDRRWVYDDPAWVDWYRDDLHVALAADPVRALVTIPHDHGAGPAAIFADQLMDQHAFRGSDGGNGVFLLWRPNPSGAQYDERGIVGNKRSGLSTITLDWLDTLGRTGCFEEAFDYNLAVLNAPSYSARFWRALEVDDLRIPLTTNPELFDAIAALGADCRGAWTASKQSKSGVSWIGTGSLPLGKATWDGDSISFANGRSIEGVHQNVWDFEVSGYRVLQKWFAAREQWIITVANSLQALGTVIAVSELVDLGPALNDALKQLVGP